MPETIAAAPAPALPDYLVPVALPDGKVVPNLFVVRPLGVVRHVMPDVIATWLKETPTWALPPDLARFDNYTIKLGDMHSDGPPPSEGFYMCARNTADHTRPVGTVRYFRRGVFTGVNESLASMQDTTFRERFFQRSMSAENSIYETHSFRWAPVPPAFERTVIEWARANGYAGLLEAMGVAPAQSPTPTADDNDDIDF